MTKRNKGPFFGWYMVGVGLICYTFVGISLWLGPSWAGAAADAREKLRAGGHDLALGDGLCTTSFGFLCVFALVSAVAAFLVRHPGPGPQT